MMSKNNHWNLRRAVLTVCFSFCMQLGFGQSVQTITDKKDILIGEQIKLTIKTSLPFNNSAGSNKGLIIPESIPHFDIVKTGKPDTTNFKDDSKTVEQIITITSFDSGRWVFPALPLAFAGAAGQSPQMVVVGEGSRDRSRRRALAARTRHRGARTRDGLARVEVFPDAQKAGRHFRGNAGEDGARSHRG